MIRPDFRDIIIAKQGADWSGLAADVVGICNLEFLLQAVTFQAVSNDASVLFFQFLCQVASTRPSVQDLWVTRKVHGTDKAIKVDRDAR